MSHTLMICSIGALLKYITDNRVGVELEDENTEVPVCGIIVQPLTAICKYRHMQTLNEKRPT